MVLSVLYECDWEYGPNTNEDANDVTPARGSGARYALPPNEMRR